MELFEIIVNGFQPLTIITKSSILDVAAVLDPPLLAFHKHRTCDIIKSRYSMWIGKNLRIAPVL